MTTVEVPYLSQTDLLCGGAAAAMVFRYWGDLHADVQQFASLVDARAGGIASDALVQAVESRGWRADHFEGSLASLHGHLAAGQPVIVLVADRGTRYHYLVVTGVGEGRVIVHDPSWGPSRAISEREFLRNWRASQFWALVIMPTPHVQPTLAPQPGIPRSPAVGYDRCDALLDQAVVDIAERGLDEADEILGAVRVDCPGSSGPLRELAGVRFAQGRWSDAAAFARAAVARDSEDSYALNLLGTSLFMQDDVVGALRAWNPIGKPQLDLVRIQGVHHTRFQAITEALDLRPNALLTADAFVRAMRRLGELPDRSAARLAVRPEADGFAALDVVIAERAVVPRTWPEWTAGAAQAGIDRTVAVSLPGSTGQGETWSASWRWWSHRPSVAVAYAVPRAGGLFGVWRVEGRWEEETYAGDSRAQPVARQSRAHGGLTVSDWLTGNVRYAINSGFDVWNPGQRTASIGGSLERRWFADRLSVSGDATTWMTATRAPGFSAVGVRGIVRSATEGPWTSQTIVGTERVSERAPLAVWAGAGEGVARQPLLRAHPLLDDGVINLSQKSIFGRLLAYASVETQRWFDGAPMVRFAVAAFADVARAARRAGDDSAMQADVGVGLRLRVPGAGRIVRVDVARGLRDGNNAVTIGWVP